MHRILHSHTKLSKCDIEYAQNFGNLDNVRIQYEQLDQLINFTMFSTLNILHGNIVDLLYASIGYQFAGKSGDYFHQPFFKLKSQRWHEVIEAKRKKRKTWCNIFIRYRVYY